MKLTKAKREWVRKKVRHYAATMSVKPPRIFMTMAQYDAWKNERRTRKGQRIGRTTCYGVCHREDGFIVILPKRSPSLKDLDDTIRHEMIHFTKSYNHSTVVFRDRMERLKKGKVKDGRFIK